MYEYAEHYRFGKTLNKRESSVDILYLYDYSQDPEKRDGTRHDALLCGHCLLLL
jgi:hypothetical protein